MIEVLDPQTDHPADNTVLTVLSSSGHSLWPCLLLCLLHKKVNTQQY